MKAPQIGTEMFDLLEDPTSALEGTTDPIDLGDSLLGDLQSAPEETEPQPSEGTTIRCNCSQRSTAFDIT